MNCNIITGLIKLIIALAYGDISGKCQCIFYGKEWPFPIQALKGFGGGDGYASAFLYGVLEGWEMFDCLELGSASASLLVASHACSQDMPSLQKIRDYIKQCKNEYGEMVARA